MTTPARRGRPPGSGKKAATNTVEGAATGGKESTSEIAQLQAAMQKRYGASIVTRGSDIPQPWRIPLNIFSFDLATLGGIFHNRVNQFSGVKHSGKTTAALKAIRGAQQSLPDQQVAMADIEGTFDETWAGKNGVNTADLLVTQPETGEQAVDICEALVRTREISLVVVDSIAALTPTQFIENSAEDPTQPGTQARLMSKFMLKISSALIAERRRGHFVSLLVINNLTSKIGGWAPPGQEAVQNAGGKKLGYTNSLEVKFKNKENTTKQDGMELLSYNEHSFKIEKNKCNGGLRDGEYQMLRQDSDVYPLYETDIDDAPAMLAHAKRRGFYTGGGKSWKLSIPEFEYTFQNAEEAVMYLYENREIYWKLRCFLIADHAARLGMKQDFVDYIMSGAY